MSARSVCHSCHSSDGLATYVDGQYCFACNKQFKGSNLFIREIKKRNLEVPSDNVPLYPKHYQWLEQYFITREKATELELRFSPSMNRIIFPCPFREGAIDYVNAAWMRSIDPAVMPKWLLAGNKDALFFYRHDYHQPSTALVITEDVISAIRVSEFNDAVALGGTNSSHPRLKYLFRNYSKLLVWLDGDVAGKRGAEKLRHNNKLLHEIKIIRTKQDPKCYSPAEIEEILCIE